MPKLKDILVVLIIIIITGLSVFSIILILPKFVDKLVHRPVTSPWENYQKEIDLVFVTKDEPRKILYINEVETGGIVQTRYYFIDNSNEWVKSSSNADNLIISDTDDETGKAGFILAGKHQIKNQVFMFDVPFISTNIAIKNLYNFSKSGGSTIEPSATLQIDDKKYPSYAAILIGHNFSPVKTNIYQMGINTKWMMYWDKDWNFYHLDISDVENPEPNYRSHVFMAEQSDNAVYYMTSPSVVKTDDKSIQINFFKNNMKNHLDMNKGPNFKFWDDTQSNNGYIVKGSGGGIGVTLELDTKQK